MLSGLVRTGTGCDFGPLWIGARALLHGTNPYAVVQATDPFPLFYPGPALLVVLPLAPLSREMACTVFAGVATGVLAFALSKTPWRLLALISASAMHAIGLSQWSTLAVAAWFLPALGVLWVAKPQVGIPALVAHPKQAVVPLAAGLALLALSLLVMPTWPQDWSQSAAASMSASVHVSPVLRPGGFLVLATLLRWRRPEARWLLAVAILPQTSVFYETFPLFVVPRTRREMATLVTLSWVAFTVQAFVPPQGSIAATTAARWPILLLCLWLPALVMVLRRPNVGADAATAPKPLAPAA